MDQGERANFEYFAAACHLPDNQDDSTRQWEGGGITNVSICLCRSQLDVGSLAFTQTRNYPVVAIKTYRELPGHHQRVLWQCRLDGWVFDGAQIRREVRLLTIHDDPHILDKTVDNLERLSSSSPSLINGESVQSMQDSLDFLLSDNFLYKFDCIALSEGTSQRKQTHWICPALALSSRDRAWRVALLLF
jgi:hypothetical protein